jgi:hypothetical protein
VAEQILYTASFLVLAGFDDDVRIQLTQWHIACVVIMIMKQNVRF